MRHTFAFTLIFLALLPAVFSQEDFSATASPSAILCPCSGQGYYITITNSGTTPSTYTLSANKEIADWITISPQSFSLKPKTAAKILVSVNSPCTTQSTFPLTLFISTSNGLAKSLSQQITFAPCYGFSITAGRAIGQTPQKTLTIEPFAGTYEACAKGNLTIPLLVRNTDPSFDNAYTFSTSDLEAKLSIPQFSLKKDASGIVLLTYAPTQAGLKTITVSGRTAKGEIDSVKNIAIESKDCYGIALEIPDEAIEMCGGILENRTLTVSNKGIFQENITVKADGAEWASIDRTSFLLPPSGIRDLRLILVPPKELSISTPITITASLAKNPHITAQDSIEAIVHPLFRCYGADVSFAQNIPASQETYVPVEITNTGEKKAKFLWSVTGADWATLDETFAELNPTEKHHATIHLLPTNNVAKGIHTLTFTIRSDYSLGEKTITIYYQPESATAKSIKAFSYLYRYYFYALTGVLIMLFLLRNIIISSYRKNRKRRIIQKARLMALAKARKARMKMAKKNYIAEKKSNDKHSSNGFFIGSWFLLFLALLTGLAFVFYPTTTMHFLQNYGTIIAVVLALGAIVAFLVKPKGRKRK